jgi:hypothetical protein
MILRLSTIRCRISQPSTVTGIKHLLSVPRRAIVEASGLQEICFGNKNTPCKTWAIFSCLVDFLEEGYLKHDIGFSNEHLHFGRGSAAITVDNNQLQQYKLE